MIPVIWGSTIICWNEIQLHFRYLMPACHLKKLLHSRWGKRRPLRGTPNSLLLDERMQRWCKNLTIEERWGKAEIGSLECTFNTETQKKKKAWPPGFRELPARKTLWNKDAKKLCRTKEEDASESIDATRECERCTQNGKALSHSRWELVDCV